MTTASIVATLAANLAKADAAFELAIPNAASALAKHLGESPSYDGWGKAQAEFVASYMKERKCVQATADNRFSAVAVYMKNNFALEKPAKPSDVAVKKAAQRDAKKEKVASVKAQVTNMADAIKKSQEAASKGDTETSTILLGIASEMQKEAAKVATTHAKEALKNEKEAIRKALLECNDVTVLKRVYDLLAGNVPAIPVSKAVKSAKPATVKKASPFDALTKPATV